jgi:site-specific DNA-methyltransferase (adenine-specific)
VKPYFQTDLVTLYLGNCLEVTEWLSADVLVTDPPYGIAWTPKKGSYTKSAGHRNLIDAALISGDDSTAARDSVLALWSDRPAIVFGSWKAARPAETKHRLIWHKAGMPPGPLNAPFMSNDEEIYVLGKGFRPSSPPLRSIITTNEHRPSAVRDAGHPTPKPIGLMETLIDRCPEGVIADPFSGSGSTLIAARNLGRKAIGIELDEGYCELIANQLSQEAFDLGGI